ncbi:MAG: AGE family epimerase/isomerase [Cypionkella sp.]
MSSPENENWLGTGPGRPTDNPAHRKWLQDQAHALIAFFLPASINPAGGFYAQDRRGQPLWPESAERPLHRSTRMVHCSAVAQQLGVAGAEDALDHGMRFLWEGHRDTAHGGYFWSVDDDGARDSTKQAYGHAFVLLAASSATMVGHPDADRLLGDVSGILHDRFWDATAGATTEEYLADWSTFGSYRGQNSNMHLTEALMAAFEATADRQYLEMAQSIASLIIDRHARAEGWRVPEHYDANWAVDRAYSGNPMLRPRGVTPGHALEWSRLLIQLWEAGGRLQDWMPGAAEALFQQACQSGWNAERGGFYYTLDWDNQPIVRDRYWWPCCEGIAAASALGTATGTAAYDDWYRRIWDFTDRHLIDHKHGGWFAELDSDLAPSETVFAGKPDLYHALQACLIPLFPADGSVVYQLARHKDQP